MIVLDLFCGLKSLYKPAKDLGFDYFSIDYDPKFNPDVVMDINYIQPDWFTDAGFHPDIIWASPPCEHFSVASIGRHWNKDNSPKTKEAEESLELVKHAVELIKALKPKYYFIENPRGKLRKLPVMEFSPLRHTVTYCQYGDFRMKPTDIWTNNGNWNPRPPCNNGDKCHVAAPRGSQTGTQGKMSYERKSEVPYDLLYEILSSCK